MSPALGPHGRGLSGHRPRGPEELPIAQALAHPLLPIAVFHIVDPAVIPVHADAQQVGGEEAILSQNHEVREEAPQGLDHTCRCGRTVLTWSQGTGTHFI